MNNALAAKVLGISQEVRAWTEELSRKRGDRCDDLNGYCAIAAVELFNRFKAASVIGEIRLSSSWLGSHAYTVVEDHIVDVTATQFSEFRNEPVVIQHERELDHLWYYNDPRVFDCPRKLRNAQVSWGWPQDQLVLTRQVRAPKKS